MLALFKPLREEKQVSDAAPVAAAPAGQQGASSFLQRRPRLITLQSAPLPQLKQLPDTPPTPEAPQTPVPPAMRRSVSQ